MPTALEQADTIIAQLQERIVEVTLSAKPDYSIDGESISRGAYLGQLHDALEKQMNLRRKLGGPFCIRSRGRAG
jgi:hypothetical protein